RRGAGGGPQRGGPGGRRRRGSASTDGAGSASGPRVRTSGDRIRSSAPRSGSSGSRPVADGATANGTTRRARGTGVEASCRGHGPPAAEATLLSGGLLSAQMGGRDGHGCHDGAPPRGTRGDVRGSGGPTPRPPGARSSEGWKPVTSIGLTRIAEMLSFRPVLVNTLAALAVLAALVLDGVLWSVLPALATLLLIGWGKRRTLVRPRGRVGGLGRSLPARYLLLAAALVQLHGIDQLGGVAIATGVLSVLALGMEKVLRASSRFAVPYASPVPGHRPRSAPPFRYGLALPLSMLSVLMLVLAPLAPEPLLLIALLLAAAALAALLLAQLDVARRIQDRRRFQAELPRILETIGPVFYLYWHAPRRSAFQVTMWLPHLERLGVPFMLVTRTASAFRQLQEATDHPVILRRSLTDLDDLIVPSVRGVFYVNNAMRNNHMVRYSQLTHIQLLHGESDKASSASPVTRMYDLNFVAGQAAIDRFERCGVPMPPGIFRITGRPQVEGIDAGRAAIEEIGTPSVLYAPTWLGNQAETNYSSLPAGPTIVRGLLERGCTVVFRPHPYSADSPSLRAACEEIRDVLAADAAATGRAHLFGTV